MSLSSAELALVNYLIAEKAIIAGPLAAAAYSGQFRGNDTFARSEIATNQAGIIAKYKAQIAQHENQQKMLGSQSASLATQITSFSNLVDAFAAYVAPSA